MTTSLEISSTAVHDLRAQMRREVQASRSHLDTALGSAWRLGRLLHSEKQNVLRRMGRGSWPTWLAANFAGSQKEATRLVRLAQSVADESQFRALSLRQAYFRLGVPTEPKARRTVPGLTPLPAYLHHAQRVLLSVRTKLRLRQMDAASRQRLREDLAPLRAQLEALFAEHE